MGDEGKARESATGRGDELQELGQQIRNSRLLATMTGMRKSARMWDGETSMINADLMTRVGGDLAAPSYYVVGPPAMVEAVQEMLRTAGVGEDRIRTEEFYGH